MTKFAIRPFDGGAHDYEGHVRVCNAVWPEYPETADELRRRDARRDAKIQWGRHYAEISGEIVGVAGWGQSSHSYHPHKFWWSISVHPDYEGNGIGAALYEAILADLASHNPMTLRSYTREDKPRALRFLADRGYMAEMREQESVLDVATFNPSRFASDLARTEQAGVVIRSWSELEGDPDRARKFYDLEWELDQDVPHTGELTRRSFEQFVKMLDDPNFLPDGMHFALDAQTGAWVGVTMLFGQQANRDLNTGLTGVLRSHRKRGIATALKVRALTWAKERGAPVVRTENEENNIGMLGINYRLGFVKAPASLSFVKHLREDK